MRVISIAPAGADAADCDEESGVVRKMNIPLARRDLLKGSGLLLGSLVTGTLLAGLAPSSAWALELKTLSTEQGQTLMANCRHHHLLVRASQSPCNPPPTKSM